MQTTLTAQEIAAAQLLGLPPEKMKEALATCSGSTPDLTINETIQTLKVCRRSVYNLAERGLITMYKIGSSVRVDYESVQRLIANSKATAQNRAAALAQEKVRQLAGGREGDHAKAASTIQAMAGASGAALKEGANARVQQLASG